MNIQEPDAISQKRSALVHAGDIMRLLKGDDHRQVRYVVNTIDQSLYHISI